MTLLITTLRLPALSEQQAATQLFKALSIDWRFFIFYISSFLTISSYWLLHHSIYTHIAKIDRVFIWLNILLLLIVTFLPFPTALMGKYGRSPDTAFIYGAVISLTYLLINMIAMYSCKNRRLLRPDIPDSMIRIFRVKLLIPLFLALTGTMLALFYVRLAFLFFAFMALANSIPWPRLLKQR